MIFIKTMAIICYLEDETSCDNVTHCTFIGGLALIKFCFIVAWATFPNGLCSGPKWHILLHMYVSMVDIGTIDHVISRLVRAWHVIRVYCPAGQVENIPCPVRADFMYISVYMYIYRHVYITVSTPYLYTYISRVQSRYAAHYIIYNIQLYRRNTYCDEWAVTLLRSVCVCVCVVCGCIYHTQTGRATLYQVLL